MLDNWSGYDFGLQFDANGNPTNVPINVYQKSLRELLARQALWESSQERYLAALDRLSNTGWSLFGRKRRAAIKDLREEADILDGLSYGIKLDFPGIEEKVPSLLELNMKALQENVDTLIDLANAASRAKNVSNMKWAGAALGIANNFVKDRNDTADGKYGEVYNASESVFNSVTDMALQSGNPWLMAAGAVGKGVDIANKLLGESTSGMTTEDAFLDSAFGLGLGKLNAKYGMKTSNFAVDNSIKLNMGGSYIGLYDNLDSAASKAGKKYGWLSLKDGLLAEDLITTANFNLGMLDDINDRALIGQSSSMLKTIGLRNLSTLNRGYQNSFRAARKGMKFNLDFARKAQSGLKFNRYDFLDLTSDPYKVYNFSKGMKYGTSGVYPNIYSSKPVDSVYGLEKPEEKPEEKPYSVVPPLALPEEETVSPASPISTTEVLPETPEDLVENPINYEDIIDSVNNNQNTYWSWLLKDVLSSIKPDDSWNKPENFGNTYNYTNFDIDQIIDDEIEEKDLLNFLRAIRLVSLTYINFVIKDDNGNDVPIINWDYSNNIPSLIDGTDLISKWFPNMVRISKPAASNKKGGRLHIITDEEIAEYNMQFMKEGGQFNIIPEGALHKNKHHMEGAEGLTKKGIPVVTIEDGKKIQLAEIERDEIIFRLEVTSKLEELAKKGTDEAAIEAGKLLTLEILHNTHDNTGLLKET